MKNDKKAWFAVVVAVAALAVSLINAMPREGTKAAQETAFERVMRTRTIRCGYATWNPILYKDLKTGEVKGISHDVMEEIGKKLDLKIEWAEETTWGTIIEGLASGRYDAICNGIGALPQRARAADFTEPFLYGGVYIAVRAGETRFKKADDIDRPDVRFSVLDGEAFSYLAPKRFPKVQIIALPQLTDWSSVFQDIVANKADVAGVTYSDFLIYDKTNPGKVKIIDKANPVLVYPVAFGLPQGDVALKAMIDAAVNELLSEGTVERAKRAYTTSPEEFLLPIKPYALP